MAATVPHFPATATQATAADRPTDATALTAFLKARAWLDADALPALAEQTAQTELPGTSAVCVILRLSGRVVGTGEDAEGDGLMLRRAMGRAVAKALGDETIRGVRETVGDRVTVRLSLEIELAGSPSPLLGRTIADAAARVVPGQDGLAVRRGDAVVRAYPSRLCSADIAERPDRTITALLIDAGLPAKDLPQYATEERVSLARFSTVRLRQPAPDAPPVPVTRAGRTITPGEVTTTSTRVLAIQLAARLAGQVVPANEAGSTAQGPTVARDAVRLLGTLNPTADAYDPPFADARQSALAALALAHAAQHAELPDPVRAGAANGSIGLLRSILSGVCGPTSEFTDALCAVAIARLEGRQINGQDIASVPAEARRALADRVVAALGRATAQVDAASTSSASSLALTAAAALAMRDTAEVRAQAEHVASGLVDALEAKPAAVLQSALPLALLAADARLTVATRGELRRLTAATTRQLMPQQVGADAGLTRDFPDDLLGGLVPPSGPRFRVEADCLLHAAAIALTFPAGCPDAPEGLSRMLDGFVRFVHQLTATDPWVDGFRRPDQIRGLVRGSLATDDCPPEATALGLLTVLGALESRAAAALPAR